MSTPDREAYEAELASVLRTTTAFLLIPALAGLAALFILPEPFLNAGVALSIMTAGMIFTVRKALELSKRVLSVYPTFSFTTTAPEAADEDLSYWAAKQRLKAMPFVFAGNSIVMAMVSWKWTALVWLALIAIVWWTNPGRGSD